MLFPSSSTALCSFVISALSESRSPSLQDQTASSEEGCTIPESKPIQRYKGHYSIIFRGNVLLRALGEKSNEASKSVCLAQSQMQPDGTHFHSSRINTN